MFWKKELTRKRLKTEKLTVKPMKLKIRKKNPLSFLSMKQILFG
jgi:hypothetical protein